MIYPVAILLLVSVANGQFDKNIIEEKLEKGLKYLEQNLNLDLNGTFNIVVAKGELIYLKMTASSLKSGEEKKITDWKKRMQTFIDYQKKTEPNDYAVANFYYPDDWVNNGDYRFVNNGVSGPASKKSLTEIYGASLKTDDACEDELYVNTKSNAKRPCNISKRCMELMTNTEDKGSVAPMHRVIFLASMNYLKCSEKPKNYADVLKNICNLLYKRILTLTEHGYVQNKAHYYMDKVLLCGTFGYAEFYNDDVLKTLIDQQNADGSIGKQPKEEKKVLTAQYVAILSSVYRLKVVGTVQD